MKRYFCIFFGFLCLCGCTVPAALDVAYVPVYVVAVDSPPPEVTSVPMPQPSPTPTVAPSAEPAEHTYAYTMEVTEEDLNLAARVAYWEMRGKGEYAYRAVLSVIYNRCMAPNWGGGVTSISEMVYRPGQFSVIHKKKFKTTEPPAEIIEYARDIFCNGNINIPHNVMFFGWSGAVSKNWGGRTMFKEIGGDYFFYGDTGGYKPPATASP